MSFPLINLILDKDIEEIIAEVPTNFKLKNKLISLGDSFWPSSLNYNDEIHQHILSISDEELEKLIKFYVLAGKKIPDLSRGSVSGAIPLLHIYKFFYNMYYSKI